MNLTEFTDKSNIPKGRAFDIFVIDGKARTVDKTRASSTQELAFLYGEVYPIGVVEFPLKDQLQDSAFVAFLAPKEEVKPSDIPYAILSPDGVNRVLVRKAFGIQIDPKTKEVVQHTLVSLEQIQRCFYFVSGR